MNWNTVEKNWKRITAKVKTQVGEASPKGERMMKEEIQSRRDVLRGALAVGCTLFVPVIFSGAMPIKARAQPVLPQPTPQLAAQILPLPLGPLKCRRQA